MKIQQIRNATIIIEYAGKRFLVDPMLGGKGSFAPFPFSHHQKLRNPLHDLPMKAEDIVHNIDCVLITHLHLDHIDDAAYKLLSKSVHIFVQDEQDRNTVLSHGFTHVEIIGEDSRFDDIRLSKTESHHGHWWMLPAAGHTCGYVLRHETEPVCYLAGDTIWYCGVRRNIDRWSPQVIIVNAGGNKFHLGGHVIMHIPDVLKAMDYAPATTFVATHLEGVNHNQVTRVALREEVMKCGKADRIHIPEDGEIVEL